MFCVVERVGAGLEDVGELAFVDEDRHLALAHHELGAVLDLVLVALEAVGQRVVRCRRATRRCRPVRASACPRGPFRLLRYWGRFTDGRQHPRVTFRGLDADSLTLDALRLNVGFHMTITLSALHIYPVKGLGGIALEEARVHGPRHSRTTVAGWWSIPTACSRSAIIPRMATVWTDLADGMLMLSAPDDDGVEVSVEPRARAGDEGAGVDAASSMRCPLRARPTSGSRTTSRRPAAWCTCPTIHVRHSNDKYAGQGKRVGFADGYAYLVIANMRRSRTLNARLAAKRHPALPMNRFRPNLVVSGPSPTRRIASDEIRVGDAVLPRREALRPLPGHDDGPGHR